MKWCSRANTIQSVLRIMFPRFLALLMPAYKIFAVLMPTEIYPSVYFFFFFYPLQNSVKTENLFQLICERRALRIGFW